MRPSHSARLHPNIAPRGLRRLALASFFPLLLLPGPAHAGQTVSLDPSGEWASVQSSAASSGQRARPAAYSFRVAQAGGTARNPALEARVRELEARVRELEAMLGQSSAGASGAGASEPAPDAIDCKEFDIRSNGVAQQRLRITANGRAIGSYQGSAGPYLTSLLRPGVNAVAFIYDSPGDGKTLLQVYCIPPEAESRVEILRFTPEPGKLEERVTVNMTRDR
jgi:hypothetical protein